MRLVRVNSKLQVCLDYSVKLCFKKTDKQMKKENKNLKTEKRLSYIVDLVRMVLLRISGYYQIETQFY